MKSSPAARRLIKAALQRFGTEAKAAYALRLESQATLSKLLRGKLKDTPKMQAALARADGRAYRAWAMAPERREHTVDVAALRIAIVKMEDWLNYAKAQLDECEAGQ